MPVLLHGDDFYAIAGSQHGSITALCEAQLCIYPIT